MTFYTVLHFPTFTNLRKKNTTVKKTGIIVMILVATLFDGKATNSEVHNNQVIEQAVINADAGASYDSTKAITKTVIIEEDEDATLPNSRNKWITAALAAFGVILIIIFRMLRKKKS